MLGVVMVNWAPTCNDTYNIRHRGSRKMEVKLRNIAELKWNYSKSEFNGTQKIIRIMRKFRSRGEKCIGFGQFDPKIC